MTLDLTPLQRDVAEAVSRLSVDGPISGRAVMRDLDLVSSSATYAVIRQLRRLGVVRFDDGSSNTLRMAPGVTMIQGVPHRALEVRS